jgi:glycine hydroxymethyltransferase
LLLLNYWCYYAGKNVVQEPAVMEKYLPDTEVKRILELEVKRQRETIDLIAAENYASKDVMEAQGSVFTNKYAEGYPEQRYYAGCVNADAVETLAINRAKQLFKAEHANVQPHSGSQANMAAYFALLEPGDTVMGMSLADGGHLTHGAKANFSGKWYKFVPYGLSKETELIDYDMVEKLAVENKPKLIMTGASSYPRTIDFKRFKDIADKVGAYFIADIAHIAGFVATGLHPSPLPMADIVTSSSHKTLRGPRSGFILCKKELAAKIDTAVFPTMQGGPQVHAIAAKAIAFYEALQPEFTIYQKAVLENAHVLATELKKQGFRLVTGGTDNHIVLIDLTSTGITGLAVQEALEEANILANRNAIPFDKRPRLITSGVRFGTPAVTTRGLGVAEIKTIAGMITRIISNMDDKKIRKQIKEEVLSLCQKYPTPGID